MVAFFWCIPAAPAAYLWHIVAAFSWHFQGCLETLCAQDAHEKSLIFWFEDVGRIKLMVYLTMGRISTGFFKHISPLMCFRYIPIALQRFTCGHPLGVQSAVHASRHNPAAFFCISRQPGQPSFICYPYGTFASNASPPPFAKVPTHTVRGISVRLGPG